MKNAITEGNTSAALGAATALSLAIRTSAEWHELESAQQVAKSDTRFAQMVGRHSELARLQNGARQAGAALDGKLLVELLALRDQIQRHEIYQRQQTAWNSVINLLQRVNGSISDNLGLDFASNAAPRSGCCG